MKGNHRTEQAMEHENTYMLMMEVLDGEISNDNRQTLDLHLQACPTCHREWQALQAIDTLFRQAPTLSPATDFAQRTIARLPNRRYRIGILLAIYVVVLIGGLLPILVGAWAATRIAPIFNEPTILNSIWQSVTAVGQIIVTVIGALFTGLGQFVLEQPAVLGWFLVLIGFIALWGGVMREVVWQPVRWQR